MKIKYLEKSKWAVVINETTDWDDPESKLFICESKEQAQDLVYKKKEELFEDYYFNYDGPGETTYGKYKYASSEEDAEKQMVWIYIKEIKSEYQLQEKVDNQYLQELLDTFPKSYINLANEFIFIKHPFIWFNINGLVEYGDFRFALIKAVCRPIGKVLDFGPANILLKLVNKYTKLNLTRKDMYKIYENGNHDNLIVEYINGLESTTLKIKEPVNVAKING